MAFPVDILTNVDHETLELTAEEYMSQLPYRNTEYFSLSDSEQIEVGLCNVSFVPLYGTDTEKKLLALFSPDDSNTIVGLYLLDRWWGVEDVLKTAEPSRTGLIKVSTLGERIVLYVLNRIVLRNEKSGEDVFFLCHCEREAAKILWEDGEAIGFYSFKPKGSLCRNFVTQCYQLPVMDTIFVRKCHRGQGHAIKILEDFVGSFRNEYIGLKFPLSEAIYKVCEKYFSRYPADKELLWEVEKIGSPFQRILIANRLQKLKLKEKDQVVSKLNFDEGDATAPMEIEITKIQETTEYTVEIVEETIIDITKVDDIPVTRRGRGSNLKRRAIRENSEERLSGNIIRVEDIEAGVESSVEVAAVENLNTFSVKESETVLRSSVDTVTATVTNFAEFRGSQKEETREIENDIVTATSEGSPVTHLTTAGEIKNQRGSKEECEMVIKEYTIDIQGATIGSIDQNQLQSVVDVEIVKMSTGTEEGKNENLGKNEEVEEDEPVCEAEMEEIKQMPDEPKEEKTASEVAEQSETRAKSTEKVQTHWDMEITENKERAEDEVMAESEKDLIEENRDENTGQEKSEPKDEDTVLQQFVEVKDQIEMEADSVREVLTTEEILCDQPKQNEAETEVPEPNQTMTNKDTLIEKASKHTLGPDEPEQDFNKRTSGLTPSRKSKRLRHQPAETDLATTKSVKTGQQRSKHHSKVIMQDEDTEQSTDEPEHDVSEVMEKIQEAQIENKVESEVEEYKEKDMLTVETVSTMDVEITQVEETVFPEVSELVERNETDQEEAPLQSSVEPPEIQESKTTPEEDEETVENSTEMLTLSEAKVVLVDLHECSPKEAGDNHGEIGIPEQEEIKLTMSSELQATEENMRKEEQDGTLDTKPMEEPACTTTTEGYVVAADANRTPEQSTAYKDQEYEPESETTEAVLLSQVEVPEITDTEQDKEDKQDLYEADKFPMQGKQTQKKGSIDIPSRSTRLKDQPVDPGVTVRCLRSTLKPVKITPVRRSTRSKAVIQQVESVEPQVDAKLRTDENPERDELIVEDVSPEENEMANTNADETASVECGSSEILRAAEIDDKEKEPQITKVTEEIPLIATEAKEDVLENRVEDIKNIENKEANLAGQLDRDIGMSSLAQEVHVQEEEVPISTERHLRRRTIRVQTPLTRKSRCAQKQKAEADVEHQERHTVVSKNKTDTILMTKEREDEMGQDVNKMENKEEHFAELEPVEEPNMSRNEYEKTSAITEETVDGCIPIITTEASLESLDEIVNTNTEETAVPESSGLPLGVEIDDQEKKIQIVDGPEKKVSLVEPGKEVENDDGTPAIKLQKATVVLVDLSRLSQNTEREGEASEDLTHFQTEEKLELYEPDTSEQELSNLALEEEEQQEEVQTQEDTEKTPEEEKMEEENTVEEQNKLDKQDMTFEEQKPTEDLATMPAEGSLVESNKIENKQNEDEGVSGLAQENAVQENLEEEAPVSTQRSLRRRTKRVQSPPRRKSRRIQKQGADVEVYRAVGEDVEEAVNSGEHPEKTTTMADERNIIHEAEKDHNITLKEKPTDSDIEMSVLAQEAPETDQEVLEEEASVSTERSLRRRTIKIQSPPRRKSRRMQKQGADVSEDKTEIVLITETEADEVDQGVEIVDKEKAPQTSIIDATEKVIPLVEAEPEDNVVEQGVEEINKLENKEANLAVTRDTGEETSEVGEEANLEQQQNEPLVKNDKETAETETSMEFAPVVSKEQTFIVGGTTIQIEKEVSRVSLVEAEPDEEGEKDDGTPVIQLQKATVVLVDLNKLSQNTEGESDTPEVLTHSQTEEKLEQDKPDNSEYQLCNLTSEEEEQLEQLKKEEDTEKTPEKDKMEDDNTVEEQNEPNKQDMIFEEQKPTEDLEEQNDLKVTEIVEVYRAVDENVEEAVNSGEHPEKTTTMADETNIIQEAEKDHNITLKEKPTDSDIEMSVLAQEAPETDQEVLEEEASVSTERSLRRRTIQIQSPPRRKSRRLQKQGAEAFEDKTRNIPIRGKVVDEMQETLKKSTVEATELIPFVEAEPEDNIAEKGVEEINKMEDKETNLAVTRDTDEETPEVDEEANLEQQQNEPLVKNDKETTETEKSMEIDLVVGKEQTFIVGGTTIQIEKEVTRDEEVEKDDGTPVIQLQIDPVVSKEPTYVVGGTTIQIEEKFSQGESTETDQSDNERITRGSLRLSAKSVTATQKTRTSTRLHKVELDPVKETNMSRNEHEETSATTEETVNVCMPIITVESNLESLDEIANTNVEETTAVEPETSELLMGEEINDKEEPSQIVKEVPPKEAEPDEEVEKDDGTPVILQTDTLLLVDLNKLSQNTEEQTDTPDVLTPFHTEEQLELYEPDKSEYQLCNLISEEDKQDMTVEGQKPTDDLLGQNDVKERENVEEYKMVIDEDVEESVTSGEHPKATTIEDKTNIIQETENNQDISLKEKQMDSDLEMRSLAQEAPETVQEVLEEEASVNTERSLRRRTVKIQSPPIKKSRRAQRQEAEVFEDKTVTVQLTGKGDEEVHKEGTEIDQEEILQKTTVEATENIVSLIEGAPDENVIEKGFEEINNMENKETNLGNEATREMERDKVNLEQQENELSVENEKETEKPTGMDEVSVVDKEQTYVLEETPIQAEEEILQVESSETNENKSERTTRRSLRINSQSITSTQKTRKSARLNKAELEPVKEAKMSRNEETSSMTAKTVNVCVPVTVETNVENLDEDRDASKREEITSDEQDIDISNDKGRVDEALPEISTDVEEEETMTLIKITENEILLEMDKMQKDVEGGVQEEKKAEPSQENTEQQQEEAVSLGENVGETDLTNEFKTTAVEEKVALENSEQEAAFITRSLRYRTVTVQSTPRSKSKHLHRQELESERETDHLNVPTGKENEALIAEDSTAEFENLETKEGEGVIETNTDGKSENTGTKDDTKEKGNKILFEIMESNSGGQVNTEQNKAQEENLEREDMPMLNEQEEEEVSSVQKEAKPLQERENEGAAEGVQGRSADLEEKAVEMRSLRKRMTVETAAPRKSKRLRKQEHDDDSEQVKEAVMGQTDSVEVTFTEDSVELRSDATAAVFEGSHLGEETLQKIQKNAQGTKSDGECNVHKDTEPGAGESQEEQKQSRLNKTQTDEDKKEVMTDEIIEEVIEQHVDVESSTNEGITLALEVEETSDQEENKVDEQSRVVMEAPKEISPSVEKYEKGEENISDDDEKGLSIGKHVVQSSSTTASTRRKSMRLQMHESKKKEDESDSESEVERTAKQRHQRKRKAITDSTSARRSKRHVRARIV
ncbi:A-kinase anchor protein 9-like isoform X2 [Sinocyclocheilus rhinocerous]|uniref:A-kinase anchor protein 9-like isoform X2 n=1 Tax=Sinocyclocheilus rhinocerous TaxID=307959 RepID=UPI0007B878F2|nr:PREDICTED: A-kinase anchor protein 9-like isoform X2 [Sinocyclocheilus rhinocerous]